MAGNRPAQDPTPIPDRPYPSENEQAERFARVLRQQREQSGGLEDASNEGDMRVQDSRPFRNLRGE